MTRTPITPDEIRKGDLIRAEKTDERPGSVRAAEYLADKDGQDWWSGANHFLLDHPTPPVELPTEPTHGWATVRDEESPTGRCSVLSAWRVKGEVLDGGVVGTWMREDVIAFVAATSVPTDALDALRRETVTNSIGGATLDSESVGKFLAAVDSANGTPS